MSGSQSNSVEPFVPTGVYEGMTTPDALRHLAKRYLRKEECVDLCNGAADLLEARPTGFPVWRDMDSAPQDGTPVILLWDGGTVTPGKYLDNSHTSHPWAGWRPPSLTSIPKGKPKKWCPFPTADDVHHSEQPDWLKACCMCNRVVDTREVADGGDPFGAELSNGHWCCSGDCWDRAIGDRTWEEDLQEHLKRTEKALRELCDAGHWTLTAEQVRLWEEVKNVLADLPSLTKQTETTTGNRQHITSKAPPQSLDETYVASEEDDSGASIRRELDVPEGMPLAQWQAENTALLLAKIQLRHGPDGEPEDLTSYLFRKIYWDLRGTDTFDINKAGPDRDGLRERAHSITEKVLRDLIRSYDRRRNEKDG